MRIDAPRRGASIDALRNEPEAREFVAEAYKHCKTIAASGGGCAKAAINLAVPAPLPVQS